MLLGVLTMFGGVWLMTRLDADSSQLQLSVAMAVLGVGLGASMQQYTLVVQNAVAKRDLGIATASTQFFRNVGATVGIAVFGSLMTGGLSRAIKAMPLRDTVSTPEEARREFLDTMSQSSGRDELVPSLNHYDNEGARTRERVLALQMDLLVRESRREDRGLLRRAVTEIGDGDLSHGQAILERTARCSPPTTRSRWQRPRSMPASWRIGRPARVRFSACWTSTSKPQWGPVPHTADPSDNKATLPTEMAGRVVTLPWKECAQWSLISDRNSWARCDWGSSST